MRSNDDKFSNDVGVLFRLRALTKTDWTGMRRPELEFSMETYYIISGETFDMIIILYHRCGNEHTKNKTLIPTNIKVIWRSEAKN